MRSICFRSLKKRTSLRKRRDLKRIEPVPKISLIQLILCLKKANLRKQKVLTNKPKSKNRIRFDQTHGLLTKVSSTQANKSNQARFSLKSKSQSLRAKDKKVEFESLRNSSTILSFKSISLKLKTESCVRKLKTSRLSA